jgi:hypothetical protein
MDDDLGGRRQRLAVPVRALIWLVIASTSVVALAGAAREALAVATGVYTDHFPLTILKLDLEQALPTWYSGGLMLFAVLLLFVCAWRAKAAGSGEHIWWLLLAIGFVYLSADEVAGIHERVADIVSRYVQTSGIFLFSWVLVGIPAVLLAGALFVPFLRRIDSRTRWLMVSSGAVFIAGSVGCEMLCGLATAAYGFNSPPYLVASTLEECLELAGVTLLIVTLLLRIRDDFRGTAIEIS